MFFFVFFWQVGSSFGQVYLASAGRERKGGVFLSGSQGSFDSGPGQKHSQGNMLVLYCTAINTLYSPSVIEYN